MPATVPDEQPRPRAERPWSRASRRSFIAAAAIALTTLPACALFAPSAPASRPVDAGVSPTATPSRLFGVIPVPAEATSTPTPEPVVVRFAHWESGAALAILDDIRGNFNQQTPNIIVRPEISAFGSHFEQLQASLAAGNAPDAFVNSGAFFFRHAQDSRLLDLTARSSADALQADDFWSEPITRPWQSKLLALPLWASVDVIFVNRDHLDQAGSAPPPDAWTWADLLDLAQRLTIGKPGETSRWGLLVVNDVQGGWGSLASSNGGSWIDVAKRQTDLGPATVDALRWLVDAMQVHHVAPDPFDQQKLTSGGTVDPFLSGNVSLLLNGSWEVPTALTTAPFRWDVLRVPRAPRTQTSSAISSIQPGCVAAATAHPDEAWRWLRYLMSPESQARWNNGKVRIPALKSACADPKTGYGVAPPTGAGEIVTVLGNSSDLHFTTNWQPFRAAVLSALEPALGGQVPLENAVANAIQAGNSALVP